MLSLPEPQEEIEAEQAVYCNEYPCSLVFKDITENRNRLSVTHQCHKKHEEIEAGQHNHGLGTGSSVIMIREIVNHDFFFLISLIPTQKAMTASIKQINIQSAVLNPNI